MMSLITLVAVEVDILRDIQSEVDQQNNVVGTDDEDFRGDSLVSDVKKSGRYGAVTILRYLEEEYIQTYCL